MKRINLSFFLLACKSFIRILFSVCFFLFFSSPFFGYALEMRELNQYTEEEMNKFRDNKGNTLLHIAVNRGYEEEKEDIVQKIIEQAPKLVNIRNGKEATPLHYSCGRAIPGKNSKPIVVMLLDNGAKADVVDEDGFTPLHFCARSGHAEAAQQIINARVDLDAKDEDGLTPLHWSAQRDHTQMIRTLLLEGANPDAIEDDGWTALHYSALLGSLKSVKELIKGDADPKIRNENGEVPLDLAESNDFEVKEYLQFETPFLSLEPIDPSRDERGNTKLHIAVDYVKDASEQEKNKIVKELIEQNPELIHARNKTEATPLHYSCGGALPPNKQNPEPIIKMLLDNKADPHAVDEDGLTPLHFCAIVGYARSVKYFIDKEANPDVQDEDGLTPLHQAAQRNSRYHTQMIKALLKNGANPDIKEDDGWTALHYSALLGSLESVKALIEGDADPEIRNENNHTPLDLTSQPEVKKYLKDLPSKI